MRTLAKPSVCQHCQTRRASRPRRLCHSCYYTPGVRDQYGPVSKFGKRGVEDFTGAARLPAAGTLARPGTEAKILVLMERCQARQVLAHPEDATWETPEGAVA